MAKSFTYYLTIFVIKLKGIKKAFSTDPIDYKKLRKGDVHFPKNKFYNRNQYVKNLKISNTIVTEIKPENENQSNKILIFVHGGAFICGPEKHHWDTIEKLSKQTNFTIWMCDYPKAPENKISEITNNIAEVYKEALEKFGAKNVFCIGDSVGGNLLITLMQNLVRNTNDLPNKLILISPVIDASFKNPAIEKIEHLDPILSKKGVLSAKMMCVENGNLDDPLISPISGSFKNFPETIIFVAENDITFPDQQLFIEKLEQENIQHRVYLGKGMPHIWPFLPVMKEAKLALKEIIKILNE